MSRAYLFDMDGVIIDSTQVHTEAWKLYLTRYSLDVTDIERRMLGKHNDALVRDFFADTDLTDELVIRHGANKEKLYRELMEPQFGARLVPGIQEFLRASSGVPAAVATNAEIANVDFVLELAGIRQYFRAIVAAQDVPRPKPYPDVYLRAAEMLRVDPSSCIVFEDSATGVAAARAAGMRVVGLLTTLPSLDDTDLAIRDFCDPNLQPWLARAFHAD